MSKLKSMSSISTPRSGAFEIEDQIPALRRYAWKLTRDADDAADVVQMCLERAVRNFHMFQAGSNLRGWLFTILYHEFISEVRRRARRKHVVPMDEWLDPGVSGGQEDAVEMAEIQRAFGRLAPKEREILRRVGIDGESYAAVGMQMNLKAGTVKSRVFRAREHLRNLLNTPVAAGAMPRNAGRIRTGGSPMP